MNRFKSNKIIIVLIFVLLFMQNSKIVSKAKEDISLFATNAIAMEASTGKVLYGKNANEKIYPASTTKLWTAYLVIKNIGDLNKVITVESDLSWVEPSSMFLQIGESFTVRELLKVLMLKSANDVAVLLAVEVAGSIEGFSQLMNEEAKKLGCTQTNFVNPNGLPDENHYSTAYDMALISRECVRNKTLMDIVSTEEVGFPASEFYPKERHYKNSNKFITGEGQMPYKGSFVDYKYDIVDGLKTGYTSVAGRCLLSTAKIGDTRVIVGVFNSKGNDVYTDSRLLIDYSLENYRTIMVVNNDKIKEELRKKIFFSKQGFVQGYLKDEFSVIDELNLDYTERLQLMKNKEDTEDSSGYTYKVKMFKNIKVNINKDDIVGEVYVYKNKEKVKVLNVYASRVVTPILDLEQMILLIVGVGITVFILNRKLKRNTKMKRKFKNMYLRKYEK